MKLAVAQQTLEYINIFEALECIRSTDAAHERYDSMMVQKLVLWLLFTTCITLYDILWTQKWLQISAAPKIT